MTVNQLSLFDDTPKHRIGFTFQKKFWSPQPRIFTLTIVRETLPGWYLCKREGTKYHYDVRAEDIPGEI